MFLSIFIAHTCQSLQWRQNSSAPNGRHQNGGAKKYPIQPCTAGVIRFAVDQTGSLHLTVSTKKLALSCLSKCVISIDPQNIEDLIMARGWLRGFRKHTVVLERHIMLGFIIKYAVTACWMALAWYSEGVGKLQTWRTINNIKRFISYVSVWPIVKNDRKFK